MRKAGAALDMLVRQFSQPLACLRELVQNSIDAGSNQVEVTLSQMKNKLVCLSVRDTGEGMDRQIIETQLTRLFASAKDGDLTKVGKFGIGFVSVFSLNPSAVVVDTGRDGESWRILFHPDKSYELLRLEQKQEGTCVQIYLTGRSTDFKQKLKRVHETLSYWCKHCRAEITFNGDPISTAFRLELPNEVYHEVPGTRMALALTGQSENFAGFYNQGLTLLEGVCSPLPYLSFKVDSRYFEHTLTRDNVIENEDYVKALKLIRQTVSSQLAPALFARLRRAEDDWDLLDGLLALGVEFEDVELFPDLSGHCWSQKQLRAARLFHQAQGDELSAALHDPAQGRIVLATGPALNWLLKHQWSCPESHSCWGFCRPGQQPELEKLLALCQPQLSAWKVAPLKLVSWLSAEPQPLLRPASGVGLVEWQQDNAPAVILLDQNHPSCQKLLRLQAWSASLAAQFLLQHYLLLLPEPRRLELGPRLSEFSLSRLASAELKGGK